MGHCVPDWHEEFDSVFKPVDMPTAFKQADMAMSKQGFASSKEMASAGLDPLGDFGDLAGWQEHSGMIECTKGLWSEHMDGDGIAPELRMGALEEAMNHQEQHGNSPLAAQQTKEAHDEMESWLQYPADESMDTDYCAEGFGNLPAQPVAVQAYKDSFASGLTTTRFVRANPFGHQPSQPGGQTSVRAANSAAALAEGAARVSGLLPSSLPEALSRVRTQAQSTPWVAAPASTGPPVTTRSAPASEKAAAVAPQGGAVSMASPPPQPRQQVYPSIFDRSRLAAAATRVGAGTKLKVKEPKRLAQLKPETGGKPAEQPQGGPPTAEGIHSKDGRQGSAGSQTMQDSGGPQNLQSKGGRPNPGSEQSLPSPTSVVSDGKGGPASNPLQRGGSGSGELSVGQPEQHPPPQHRFGGDKSLEERQKELQAELVQKQAEASAHLQRQQQMRDQQQRADMQRWGRGQISPVQLPLDRPRTGFKQIQPKPAEGMLYELGRGVPCYPPQSFMQQHAMAAEAMRSGRQSMDAGPSGQEGSVVLSSSTQERANGPVPGPTHAPSVRAPAWASLMQRGPAPPSPVVAPKGGRGGKERSSTGSRALQDAPKASTLTGRDSVNDTTVTSSYSEGDSLATSRAYQQNPLTVGRKRERCAKSDTEALEEDNDTLTEGTWATGEAEGRAPAKKDKGKRARAAEVHNQSERRRRDRINDRMRALQELIPNSNKTDKASVLDEAIEYLKNLQTQLQFMSMRAGFFTANLPPSAPHGPTPSGMPGFSLPPMHPPSAHLPPMHPPLGMPHMPFPDHPMFATSPTMSHEEGAELKPGRPYGDSSHESYIAQEQHREAGPFHPRLDLYEGYHGHGHPSQQPSPRFDQGGRQ